MPRSINWYAPRERKSSERVAVEGMRAAPGESDIQTRRYFRGLGARDVAERDVGVSNRANRATITVRGMPGRMFEGRIEPHLSAVTMTTRTTRVRIELANADGALLPNMFAEAEIATGPEKPVLAVPDSAVIDSGRRRIVLLDKGEAASSRAK